MERTYTENGQNYRFNREYARSLIGRLKQDERMASQHSKRRFIDSTKGPTRQELFEEIGKTCYVEMGTVKKWFQIKNPTSPNDIATVHKLEAFLSERCEEPVDLLIPFTITEGKMKSSISDSEKNCARELYSCLLNTIDQAVPDYHFVLKNKSGALNFISSISESRYEAIMAVKKTAFDLPESLRSAAITLIEDAYGPESDEPGAFFNTEDYKAFIEEFLKGDK